MFRISSSKTNFCLKTRPTYLVVNPFVLFLYFVGLQPAWVMQDIIEADLVSAVREDGLDLRVLLLSATALNPG